MKKDLPLGFWSIGRKMVLLLWIIFLPASVIIVVSNLTHSNRAFQADTDRALLMVQNIAARHEQVSGGTKQMLSTLAQLPAVQRLDGQICKELFGLVRKNFPFYGFIGAVNLNGDIFACSPAVKNKINLGDRQYFIDAVRTQHLAIGGYHIGRVSNVGSLTYAQPVFDAQGKMTSVLIAGFNVDEYGQLLKGVKLPQGATFTVTDRNGLSLYCFPESKTAASGRPIQEYAFREISSGRELGTFTGTDENGVSRIYAFLQLRLNEDSTPYLYLILGTTRNQFFGSDNFEMLGYLGVLTILGLLAVGLVWRYLNHQMIQPVYQLVETTQRFGRGEMGARTGLEHSTTEVGLLAKSFDDMASLLEMREIERKKAEAALRTSEEMFRLLVENAPDAIFVQAQGSFTYVNPEAMKLFGASSKDDLIGEPIIERLHPDFRQEAIRMIQHLNAEKRPAPNSEQRFLRLDGTTVDVETSAVPIDYDGKDGALVFVRDITERKLAKEEHDHLNRLNRLILWAASEGIVGLDAQGRAIFTNPSSATILGYSIEEMLGNDMHELIHSSKKGDPAHASEECPMHIALKTGNPCSLREEVLWRKNGEEFPALYSCTPIIEAGKIIGAVLTIRDMTEHKKNEEIKSMLESKLSQVQKFEAIATLAGGIAHDFNNMLAPIIGFTEIALRDPTLPGSLRNGLEQVFNAGLRAKDLVKQILTFSRPGHETTRVPLEIRMVVSEVLKLLRASLPVTIEIKHQLEPGRALADATQIHQVLMNLCVNAAQAMDNSGVLEVNLNHVDLNEADLQSLSLIGLKPGPFLRLTVSDTGSGMDASTIQRIFEPYFTTKEVGKGTGLGLAVVHGIVKRHEGAVTVQSTPGQGSTFSIYLPELPEAALMLADQMDELETGDESVLFIDDEQSMVDIGAQILSRLGYRVTTADDGLKALEMFRADPDRFDLIITDYTMPKITGTELAVEIHKTRPTTPVIICTGFSEKVTYNNAAQFGVELILKPFVVKDIAFIVRKVLDRTS